MMDSIVTVFDCGCALEDKRPDSGGGTHENGGLVRVQIAPCIAATIAVNT